MLFKTDEIFYLDPMKDALTYQVDKLLSEGKSRFHIWKRLKSSENADALRHTLNNKALLKDKQAYRYLNLSADLNPSVRNHQ